MSERKVTAQDVRQLLENRQKPAHETIRDWANLLIEREREECARLADAARPADPTDSRFDGAMQACRRIAFLIRERGAP